MSRNKKRSRTVLVPQERIESKILLMRGRKVMLDRDLAALYGVPTKVLNQAVRRNGERFPSDFMFQMTKEEMKNWKSQFVTSNKEKMGLRKSPFAFTENGVAMLSGVLHSKTAIRVNIQIMRTFTRLGRMLLSHEELRRKIEDLEAKYDHQFRAVFQTIKQLLQPQFKHRRRIGFHAG